MNASSNSSRGCRYTSVAMALAFFVFIAPSALAEKADREKPINLEADKVSLDDSQKVSVFEGNVILSQGTTKIVANKITVRQDKQGNQTATAIGKPATFHSKRDGAIDEYVDGSAERIEYDSKTDKVELFTNAVLKRNKDEVRGNYVSYEGSTEYYQALAAPSGRVTVTMQPKPRAAQSATTPAKEQ